MELKHRRSDPRLAKAFEACRWLSALDIARQEGLDLKRHGNSWWCCCPFHAERTASFRIKNGSWHCFGCNAGGNALSLYARLHGLDLKEAALALAGMTHLPQHTPRKLPPPPERFLDHADPDGFTWDRLCQIRNRAEEDLAAYSEDVCNGSAGSTATDAFWEAVAVREETEKRLDSILENATLWNDATEARMRAKWLGEGTRT